MPRFLPHFSETLAEGALLPETDQVEAPIELESVPLHYSRSPAALAGLLEHEDAKPVSGGQERPEVQACDAAADDDKIDPRLTHTHLHWARILFMCLYDGGPVKMLF